MSIVSTNPDTFIESAYVDDVDATITECRYELFDYNGKVIPAVPVMKVTYDIDRFERPYIDRHSLGLSSEKCIPSADGKTLVTTNKDAEIKLTKGTLGGVWLREAVQAGFPKTRMTGDLSEFDGLRVHLRAIPNPLKKAGDKQKDTILVIESLIDTPKSAPSGSSQSASDGNKIDALAEKTLERVISANGGSIPSEREEITKQALKLLKDDGVNMKERMMIVGRIGEMVAA